MYDYGKSEWFGKSSMHLVEQIGGGPGGKLSLKASKVDGRHVCFENCASEVICLPILREHT